MSALPHARDNAPWSGPLGGTDGTLYAKRDGGITFLTTTVPASTSPTGRATLSALRSSGPGAGSMSSTRWPRKPRPPGSPRCPANGRGPVVSA
jgi:hypothetical protein